MQRINLLLSTLLFVCLVLVNSPVVYANVQSNMIMLFLTDRLLHSDSYRPTDRSLVGVLSQDRYAANLAQAVRHDAVWRRASTTSRWSLGRLSLAVGDTEAAQHALYPLAQAALTNSFIYLDLLQSLSPEQAIKFYEAIPPTEAIKAISDTIALAYLKEGASQDLPEVLLLRPEDLYTNYALWKGMGQDGTAQNKQYFEKLQKFNEESLNTAYPQLLSYISEVMPSLLVDGIWDIGTTQAAVSYLVWKYHASLDVEQLLRVLIAKYPETPEWHFLLGELHERNGNIADAEYMYRDTLSLAGAHLPALRRLGFLLEIRSQRSLNKEILVQAQALLDQYLSLEFDDVVALRSLVAIYERQQPSQAESLRKRLDQLLDNKRYVANTLNVSSVDVEIGTNLLSNGKLINWMHSRPENFNYNVYAGPDSVDGAFASGHDLLEFNSMRLLALRTNETAQGGLPYAEYISNEVLIGPYHYLVTIEYCMSNFSMGYPLIYLGKYNNTSGVVFLHTPLPRINGGCRLARFMIDGSKTPGEVSLLIRNWGKGDLQVLNLTLEKVSLLER